MTTSLCLLQTGMGNGKLPFVFCKWKRKTEVCFPLSANDSCFSRVPIYGYTYEQCIDQVHVHIYAESWPAVVCLLKIVHQLLLFSTFRPTYISFFSFLSFFVGLPTTAWWHPSLDNPVQLSSDHLVSHATAFKFALSLLFGSFCRDNADLSSIFPYFRQPVVHLTACLPACPSVAYSGYPLVFLSSYM
jgi:hypothetical protein